MKFGPTPLAACESAVLAHTLRLAPGIVLKKGHILTSTDVQSLQQAGISHPIVATLDPGDVIEDQAAQEVAQALAGAHLTQGPATTGRCNLYAAQDGLVSLDEPAIHRLNHQTPDVTFATLAPHAPVRAGQLVATLKIIPFAVPRLQLDQVLSLATPELVAVRPFQPHRVGLVLTRLPQVPERILDRAAAAQRVRIQRLGSQMIHELRCPHDASAVAEALHMQRQAGCDLFLVLSASAIVDRADVVPRALTVAGGTLVHFGMPVDPGNLLLLGSLDGCPVLGVPGCARSLRRSGYDWVLERLCARLPMGPSQIMQMGVGGLLADTPFRPQPREESLHEQCIGAIVLAAGQSSRMPTQNKLLADLAGQPLLTHLITALVEAAVSPILVVTGHDAPRIRAALAAFPVQFVHNDAYTQGMGTSLATGIARLHADFPTCDGAFVCLGDMPALRAGHIEALRAPFDPQDGRDIVQPVYRGQSGHPVLFARALFPELMQLSGDVGAKSVIARHADTRCLVPMLDEASTQDVDTEEALHAVRLAKQPPIPQQ